MKAELSERVVKLDCQVMVVPDLCGLAARRDSLLAQVAEREQLQILACYPRAVRWLFAAAGVELAEGIEVLNQRTMSMQEIARALEVSHLPPAPSKVVTLAAGDGWEPWFPVIDRDRCTDCGQCASFCLFGVYQVDEDKRVEVSSPASCKDNCPACARICPEAAIIFPKLDESPLNGDLVSPDHDSTAPIKVDVEGMLGEDVYKALSLRQQKHQRRLLRKSALAKAKAERERCACQAQPQRRLAKLLGGKRR